ncbi:MAG: hypothetical protein ACKVOR_02750 [Flavobacteriales bacterium]
MTRKTSLIYLIIAPVLFALSWYISHRIYEEFLLSNQENVHYKERSLLYASFLTGLYLVAFFVIKDLFRKTGDR